MKIDPKKLLRFVFGGKAERKRIAEETAKNEARRLLKKRGKR